MANAAHAPDSSHYYVPHASPWPIRGSVALFAIMLGAVSFFNDWAGGWAFLPGGILIAYIDRLEGFKPMPDGLVRVVGLKMK